VKLALVRCEKEGANWVEYAINGVHVAMVDIAEACGLDRVDYCDELKKDPQKVAGLLETVVE